mmetsp:Transcript_19488/g.46515  ORF Transcript_19488/g.46515 Transcript_19488/m.46515 type:complete len:277 (-) Transcript_19488:477-1307(-)
MRGGPRRHPGLRAVVFGRRHPPWPARVARVLPGEAAADQAAAERRLRGGDPHPALLHRGQAPLGICGGRGSADACLWLLRGGLLRARRRRVRCGEAAGAPGAPRGGKVGGRAQVRRLHGARVNAGGRAPRPAPLQLPAARGHLRDGGRRRQAPLADGELRPARRVLQLRHAAPRRRGQGGGAAPAAPAFRRRDARVPWGAAGAEVEARDTDALVRRRCEHARAARCGASALPRREAPPPFPRAPLPFGDGKHGAGGRPLGRPGAGSERHVRGARAA